MSSKPLKRSCSVSSAGKLLDHYFSGPYKNIQQTKTRSLDKVGSLKSIRLPQVKKKNDKQQIQKKSKQKNMLKSRNEKTIEIESKIKQQIALLRSKNNNKLIIQQRKKYSKQSKLPTQSLPQSIQSWKDLKKIAPTNGYLYIDCQSQPKVINKESRKITLSDKWVLITEPQSQSLVCIDEYAVILSQFEHLNKITFFRCFRQIKIFRKWKLFSKFNQQNSLEIKVENIIKKVYRNIYYDIRSLFETIRKYKFISASQNKRIVLIEYPEYLFNSSVNILSYIHSELFVNFFEICFRPIRQAIFLVQHREDEKRKLREQMKYEKEFLFNYVKIQDELVQIRLEERLKRIRIPSNINKQAQAEYKYIKSTTFEREFMEYFKILKKCLYIYNEAYLSWVKNLIQQLQNKLSIRITRWTEEKEQFHQIIRNILNKDVHMIKSYSPDLTIGQIQLINYDFQLNQKKNINFDIKEQTIVKYFKQYIQYLILNLNFNKVIQSYLQKKYEIQSHDSKHKYQQYPQIELFLEVFKTNDCYNYEELLNKSSIKSSFDQKLQQIIHQNFQEIERVVKGYNLFTKRFYQGLRQNKKHAIPSLIHKYLQSFKIKLSYMPDNVNIGLFALSFAEMKVSLGVEIDFLQTQNYINVPNDYKIMFDSLYYFLHKCYNGIKTTVWNINDLIQSYHFYESYEQYRLSATLHNNFSKLKGYLDILSVKCPNQYEEALIMFLRAKQLKQRLNIKCEIFNDKIPKKLNDMKQNAFIIKQSVWKSLLQEQNKLTILIKNEDYEIVQKLQTLRIYEQNLYQIKKNIDILAQVTRIQSQYFIEQDLKINNYSYNKLINDFRLLGDIMKNYTILKQSLQQIGYHLITQIDVEYYLKIINININSINENYLLLVAYQNILILIIGDYVEWKKYFQTIKELKFLKVEELNSAQLFKEYTNKDHSLILNFDSFCTLDISQISSIISQIKLIKQKKFQLSQIFNLIQGLEKKKPFKCTHSMNQKNKQILSSYDNLSAKSEQELINTSKFNEFQQIVPIQRSLQFIKSKLTSFSSSTILGEQKLAIMLALDKVDKVLTIFQMILSLKELTYKALDQSHLDKIYQQGQQKFKSQKMLIVGGNYNLFQQYKNKQKQVADDWKNIILQINTKYITQLINQHSNIIEMLQNYENKMITLQNLVEKQIQKTAQMIPFLKFLDKDSILHIIKHYNNYLKFFYPIKQIIHEQDILNITTIYGQKLLLPLKGDQNDKVRELLKIQEQMNHTLRRFINLDDIKYPIDNISNFMKEQVPLQIIYALDQIYLGIVYISSNKSRNNIIKNIQGQIKLICRTRIKYISKQQSVKYCILLCEILIHSRMQLRTRLDNQQNSLWSRQVLIIEIFEQTICLRNFNIKIPCSFKLIDYSNLPFFFSSSEKNLLKICNIVTLHESLIVEQTDLIKNLSARLMVVYFQLNLVKENIFKVLSACRDSYPIFVVGKIQGTSNQLYNIYEQLNKFEGIVQQNYLSRNQIKMSSIFIYPRVFTNNQLDDTLKLRFRTLAATYPSPKLILCTKLIITKSSLDKKLFLDIVFILNCLLIEMRSRHRFLNSSSLCKICDAIFERVQTSIYSIKIHEEILIDLFYEYFECIEIDFKKDILKYVKFKNRTDYIVLSNFELSQQGYSIKQNQNDQIEQISINYKNIEYEAYQKSFEEYILNLNYLNQAFIQALEDFYEISFNFKSKPIAIIGSRQSGKSLLLSKFHQFIQEVLGPNKIFWEVININIYNDVKLNNKTQPLHLKDYEFIKLSQNFQIAWIIFDDFINSQNVELIQTLFNSNLNEANKILFNPYSKEGINFYSIVNQLNKLNINLKKLHENNIVFELSNIKNIAPIYLSMMSKIYLNQESLPLKSIYILKVNNFIRSFLDQESKISFIILKDFQELFNYIQKLIIQLLITNYKNIEWLYVLSPKTCLQRTFNFFISLFNEKGKEYLEFLYESNSHQFIICKIMTYSLYCVIQNFIDKKYYHHIEKIIYSSFHSLYKDQKNDEFLQKTAYLTSKEINFKQSEQIDSYTHIITYQSLSFDNIQTQQFNHYIRRYIKNLVRNNVPIIILGQKQAGKTTLIKTFLGKYLPDALQLNGKLKNESYAEIKSKFYKQQFQSNKKLKIIIYVENVSLYKDETDVQKYIKFLENHGHIIKDKFINKSIISSIIQRRDISQQFYLKLWKTFFIYFQVENDYYENVFHIFLSNKINKIMRNCKYHNFNLSQLKGLINQQISLINYCFYTFPKDNLNWFYSFNNTFFKKTINDVTLNYKFTETTLVEDFNWRIRYSFYNQIIGFLSLDRQIQDFKRYCSDIFAEKVQQFQNQIQNKQAIKRNSIQREKIASKQILRRYIISDNMIKFFLRFEEALNQSCCIMVNKIIISHTKSVGKFACEVLNIKTIQLLYCQNETKFLNYLQQQLEQSRKCGEKYLYYFLSLEQIATNPKILQFITNYILNYQNKNFKDQQIICQLRFIIEYSVKQLNIIAQFLKNNISQISRILYFNKQNDFDSKEIVNDIIKKNNISTQIMSLIEQQNISKNAIKIFEDLKSIQIPKSIDKHIFHHQYTYGQQNFVVFLQYYIQKYLNLMKQIKLKNNMLEISLGALAFLFKQYKQLKSIKNKLQLEQNLRREQTNNQMLQLRSLKTKYDRIQSQNIMTQIKQNERQITSILRQIDQIVSSQAIWQKIYQSAHASISRSQLAQLKYLFVTNYLNQIHIFELIGKISGQKVDKISLKRCFSDINFMSRLKQIDIRQFSTEMIDELQEMLQIVYKKGIPNCSKNIIEWISIGCKIGKHRLNKTNKILSLERKVLQIQQKNKQISETNKIIVLEKEITTLQNNINHNTAQLATLQLKLKKINDQIRGFEDENVPLINFEQLCGQELQRLSDKLKKIQYFCLLDTIDTTILSVLDGEARAKIKQIAILRLRKLLKIFVNNEDCSYFRIIEQSMLNGKKKLSLLKPKSYLSSMLKKIVKSIDQYLSTNSSPLIIIDPRSIMIYDTQKDNTIHLKMNGLLKKCQSFNFDNCKILLLECESWFISIKQSYDESSNQRRYYIIRYKHVRIAVPASVSIILLMKEWGPEELINNYRIFNLEFSQQDIEEIVKNTLVEHKEIKNWEQKIFQHQLILETLFLNIVRNISKYYQHINVKNRPLIKQLITQIEKMNKELMNIEVFKGTKKYYSLNEEDIQFSNSISQLFNLTIRYFPQMYKTACYFREIMKNSLQYIQIEGFKNANAYVFRVVFQLLTEGMADKQIFIFFYYTKIYALEKGIASKIESQNLSFILNPVDQAEKVIKEGNRNGLSFSKLVLYNNNDLERIYNKIQKKNLSQFSMQKLIEAENISLFNKLILKKLLTPNIFKRQIRVIITKLQVQMNLNNTIFLKRIQQKYNIFCICDASYWVYRLKFPQNYKIYALSEIARQKYIKLIQMEKNECVWIIYDDVEPIQRQRIIEKIAKYQKDNVSFIMMLKGMINPEYQLRYKFISFKRLIKMFEIQEFDKQSHTKLTNVLKTISKYKDELIAGQTFNCKYINQMLFYKVRDSLSAEDKYKENIFTVLHFEWYYFQWNNQFLMLNNKLQLILEQFKSQKKTENKLILHQIDNNLMNNIIRVSNRLTFSKINPTFFNIIYQLLKDEGFYYKKVIKKQGQQKQKELIESIVEKQLSLKEKKINQYLQQIKIVHFISKNKIDLNVSNIKKLQDILKSFDYDDFLLALRQVKYYKKRIKLRKIIELDKIDYELHLYFLFEQFTFTMFIFNNFTKADQQLYKQIEQNSVKGSIYQIQSQKRIQSNDQKRNAQSIRRMSSRRNSLIKPNQLSQSKIKFNDRKIDLSGFNKDETDSDFEKKMAQNMFKNKIYVIGYQTIGLLQIKANNLQSLNSEEIKRVHLMKNTFSIKYIEFQEAKKAILSKKGNSINQDKAQKRRMSAFLQMSKPKLKLS